MATSKTFVALLRRSGAAAASALLAAAALVACGANTPPPTTANYAQLQLPSLCAAPGKGKGGASDDLVAPGGARFNVRAPQNYQPTLGHPLLVVYAPGGRRRDASEAFYGLTAEATARGFVVAYADHLPLKMENFDPLGAVVPAVAQQWCIDPARVYALGHSDGGTTAQAVVFLGKTGTAVAAIAASGAGIRGQDLAEYACPAPTAALIVHSRDDHLFRPPAYGRDAAQWWARCNRCDAEPVERAGCLQFQGCAAPTLYCETRGPHANWSVERSVLLDFLAPARTQVASPR